MLGLRAKTIIAILVVILTISLTYISFFINHGVDLGDVIHAHQRDFLLLAFITLMVLALAGLILYRAFSIFYGRVLALNEELSCKNEELRAAARNLEDEVAARTAELAEANGRLHAEIRQRHEANQSLARSLEEWQSTFDAIADPVTILDKNLQVVSANRAAQQILSRGGETEVIGRTCYELYAGSSDRCPTCPAEDVFSKGARQGGYEVEHEFIGKSLLASCAPIFVNGDIKGFVHTAKDVTREKALKKQLAQAQKMEAIATLAGGIAHDFNNILGAILGNADLLLFRIGANGTGQVKSELNAADVENHVLAIKKAGNRAKELVGQILAFSRQGKTQRRNAVITPVIKEGIKLLRSSLPANIEIRAELASDICRIYADLTQVHQVLMNLCTNAAQAMAETGGVLTVSLRGMEAGREECREYTQLKPGRYVVLSVRDTGHGMTPGIMERMFDPFFTTRDVGEGTGMGLAVLHGIIASHDGILDVKSKVGEGSEFTVFFPCVHEDVSGGEDVILGVPRGSETILFVDDEEDIVKMTSRMLEYLGYTVYTADSGEAALALLEDRDFAVDLIITDYSMPGISGIDLAEKAGMMSPGLPVILCSGFSESVVCDKGARSSTCTFMSKPLDMKKLAAAIRDVFARTAGEKDAGSDH